MQSKEADDNTIKAIHSICKAVKCSHQNDEFKKYEDLDQAPSLDKIALEHRWAIVREFYNVYADAKGLNRDNRIFVGLILTYWIRQNAISKQDYIRGLTEYLEQIEDLEIDVPKIWEWTVESICKLFIIIYISAI